MILDYICKDEDECLFEDMCSTESSCKNNVGSFECICNRGFRKQEKRHIVNPWAYSVYWIVYWYFEVPLLINFIKVVY